MRTIVFLFVLIFLNSLCFGQTYQSGTKQIMIKGQMVDVPVFTTKSGDRTYYDAHPEERDRDAATQSQTDKLIREMQEKLIEDKRTKDQGYGKGFEEYHRHSTSPSPPSISSPPSGLIEVHGGAIDSQTGIFYPRVKGGVISPGGFMPDVGGGYIDPTTGRFIPKQ